MSIKNKDLFTSLASALARAEMGCVSDHEYNGVYMARNCVIEALQRLSRTFDEQLFRQNIDDEVAKRYHQ